MIEINIQFLPRKRHVTRKIITFLKSTILANADTIGRLWWEYKSRVRTWDSSPDDSATADRETAARSAASQRSRQCTFRISSQSTSWSRGWWTRRREQSPAACNRLSSRAPRSPLFRVYRPAPRSRLSSIFVGRRCMTVEWSCRIRWRLATRI